MEILSRILELVFPGPWPSAIALAVLGTALIIYRIYSRALSERGPAAKRIRQNLEKPRSDLREHYYFVLLSLRTTLDDNLGPPKSAQSLTRSFEVFLKVSALYSLGTMLLIYIISGKSPAFFQLFTSISLNERGVLAVCSVVSLMLATLVYLESKQNIIHIAMGALMALVPFVLAAQLDLLLANGHNSTPHIVFVVYFLAFSVQLLASLRHSGFVAFVGVVTLPLSLLLQLSMMISVLTFLGVSPETFLKKDVYSIARSMTSLFVMMIVTVAASLLPFAAQVCLAKAETLLIRKFSATSFYVGFVVVALAAFVAICESRGSALAVLLLPVLALPLVAAVLDWLSFQAADRLLTWSIRNNARAIWRSMFANLLIAIVSSTAYLVTFLTLTKLVARSEPAVPDFKLVDLELAVALLKYEPLDPRVWWLYALMFFNFLPLAVNIATAVFGVLSWNTPRWLADRYSEYIRRGFKGDYPRLLETSAFLAGRALLSVFLSLAIIALGFSGAAYTFLRVVSVVAAAFS